MWIIRIWGNTHYAGIAVRHDVALEYNSYVAAWIVFQGIKQGNGWKKLKLVEIIDDGNDIIEYESVAK